MGRAKRMERVVALTKILVDHPQHLFSFSYFCKKFEVAKSTLSEDVLAVKNGLELFGLGKVETLAGAAGGVRFVPGRRLEDDNEFLEELAVKLSSPDRILPGGILYITDILCNPQIVFRLGEIFMSRLQHLAPDYVMTVETRGISLALLVARAFNVPLVMARHDNYITEGPTVNINYVSGSSKTIRTMALPKRVLQPGKKVLIVDDVMKGGGTARGMMELVAEVGATVVGKAFLIATAEPEAKLIGDYTAFLRLHDVNEETRKITIEPILG
ncbi:MAG: pur operon repressor [Phascolarctobacterium sp.]|nr:pur operon repressor [Phascolarctobacterium sp.]